MRFVLVSKEAVHSEKVRSLVVQVNEMGLCLKFLQVGAKGDALLDKSPNITVL
jgi:hypothetical protein